MTEPRKATPRKKAEPPAPEETPANPATYTASMDQLKEQAAQAVTEPKKSAKD